METLTPPQNSPIVETAKTRKAGPRRIDLQFRGVGRLRITTDKYSAQVHSELRAMLRSLHTTGKMDLLRGIKSGAVDPFAVFLSYQRGELKQIRLVEEVTPAKLEMLRWLEKAEVAERTRKSYRWYINDLFREHDSAKISDIPDVLLSLRRECERLGQRTKFARCKAVALSYCSHTYGRESAMWSAVANIKGLKHSSHTHTGQARSVQEVVAAVGQMRQPYGAMFWSMCITGMGTKEFFEDGFDILADAIAIHGQKRKSRERIIPLVFSDVVQPSRLQKAMRAALHDVRPDWQLYDARRSFQHWAEMSGIPVIRIKLYAGHRITDVSERYRMHEVNEYLTTDSQLLRTYIASCLDAPKASVPTPVPLSPTQLRLSPEAS